MRNVATSIFYLKPFARIYEERADTLFLSAFSPAYSLSTHPSPCYISRFSWSRPSFSFPATTPTILILLDPVRSFPFYPPLPRDYSPRYLFNRARFPRPRMQDACHIQDLMHRKT